MWQPIVGTGGGGVPENACVFGVMRDCPLRFGLYPTTLPSFASQNPPPLHRGGNKGVILKMIVRVRLVLFILKILYATPSLWRGFAIIFRIIRRLPLNAFLWANAEGT